MIKFILLIFIILTISSCSIERKLSRKYEGEGREQLLLELGEPMKIVDLGKGIQRFIYIKEKFIKETEIGMGRSTLDPRISPSFIKEETYRFDIDEKGTIIKTEYEKKVK